MKSEEPDVGGVADLLHAGATVEGEKYPAAGQRSEILERSPYHYLLEDSDVRRWFRNVKRGSQVTAYEWIRRLGWVCREFKVTPQQLARMKPKTATDFVLDMVSELEDRKFSGNYIDNLVKPIRSWFDYKQIPLRSKIKIVGRGGSVRYKGEHVPLPEELKRVLDAIDLRKRVAVALVAFLGVRRRGSTSKSGPQAEASNAGEIDMTVLTWSVRQYRGFVSHRPHHDFKACTALSLVNLKSVE